MAADGSNVLGVPVEHMAGLWALLLAPVGIWLSLFVTRRAAAAGHRFALRFVRGYDAADSSHRAAAGLMAVSAAVHLALAPAHAGTEPGTALLFVLDGAALACLAAGSFFGLRWRGPAALLIIATVLAYVFYLASRREDPDQLGMATKLVELAALGFILLTGRSQAARRPSLRRLIAAAVPVLALMVMTSAVSWAAEYRQDAGGDPTSSQGSMRHEPGMVMQDVPTKATPMQVQAAAKLAADTTAALAQYQDLAAALHDGYRPSTDPHGQTVHYLNAAYMKDGRILDPRRPEALVYANTAGGTVLLGAMYVMPKPGIEGPDVGGPITDWHRHDNVCFSLTTKAVAGLLSPLGTCPAGSINVRTAAMLHVWTIDNPTGSYGELDRAWLQQLTHR